MSQSVFEQLIFQPGPLGELPPIRTNLQVQFAVGSSGKAYQQPVPLFARRPPMAPNDINWPAYCGLLKDVGIPLQIEPEAFEQLSVNNVPPRFARRAYADGFKLDDLSTCEAIELRCIVETGSTRWARLPLEVTAWHELKQMIEVLRDVTGGSTPIGIGMLAGDVYTDISNALAARVDFIILETGSAMDQVRATDDTRRYANETAQLDQLAWSIVAARQAAIQSGSPVFPIFVDAPLGSLDHLIKLLALGASAVSIDALAKAALQVPQEQSSSVPKGLLSGIGALPAPTRATPNVEPLAKKLNELLEGLRTRLAQQQVDRLSLLNADHLRALNANAAKLCAVKMLDHVVG